MRGENLCVVSNFQICGIVLLTIVTIVNIRFPELTHNWKHVPFDNIYFKNVDWMLFGKWIV